MKTPTESPKLPQDDSPSVVKADRRRLLKVGVAVAPVILTLSSRSVLACHCRTPSAGGSLTHASHRPSTEPVDGFSFNSYTFAQWKDRDSGYWPAGYTKNSKFNSLFPSSTDTTKIKDLTNQFKKDLVAAFLNIKVNVVVSSNCLTITQLQDMSDGAYMSPSGYVLTGQAAIQYWLDQNYLLGSSIQGRPIA